MKKINFSEIKFRPNLFAEPAPIEDIHKQIANALWQNKDIAAGKLALKLFDHPDIELSDADVNYIKGALDNFFQWVKTPILEALGEKAE